MEEAELRAKMARMTRLFGSASVPPARNYVTTRSGLIVPSGVAPPSPMDQVKSYITAEDVFGFAPEMYWVERQLQDVGLEDVLQFTAKWLHELRRSGADIPQVDLAAADAWFVPGVREKVKNLCRTPSSRGHRSPRPSQIRT